MTLATVDIEANGLDINEIDTIFCASVKERDTGTRYDFTPSDIHLLPERLDRYASLSFHGGTFYDLPVLKKVLGWEPRSGVRIYDTLLMSRLQRPDRLRPPHCPTSAGPHSVQAWGYRVGRGKPEHEQWDVWSPEMSYRCAEDCEIQHLILEELEKEAVDETWTLAHRLTQKLFHYLQLQERRGWNFNRSHCELSIAKLSNWIERIDRAITPHLPYVLEICEGKKNGEIGYVRKPFVKNGDYSAATKEWLGELEEGIRGPEHVSIPTPVVSGPFARIRWRKIDLDKNGEVKKFLLAEGWEPDEWNYDGEGNRSTPKLSKNDNFSGVQGGLGKLLVRRVQCKQRRGVLAGWLNAVRDDGRIATPVSGLAATGRLRHSEVVNVPNPETKSFFAKEMRRCFVATPGYIMVGVDSKGNQIRQLAARMGDEEFTRACLYGTKEEGTDLHSLTQSRARTATRTTAKNFFYGLIFGAGDRKLSKYGRATRAEFLAQLPALDNLLKSLSEQWRKTAKRGWNPKYNKVELQNGYITGLDGRPIRVEHEKDCLNYQLQSDEAIQMGAAYCYIHSEMQRLGYSYGTDWGSLIWYHDEFQMEALPHAVDDLERIMVKSIAWSGRFYRISVPHEGEAKRGYDWSGTH